jgi:hypothetical protein
MLLIPCLLTPVKLALLPTPAASSPLLLWAAAAVLVLALLPRAAAATLLLAARLGGFLYALQPQTCQHVEHVQQPVSRYTARQLLG